MKTPSEGWTVERIVAFDAGRIGSVAMRRAAIQIADVGRGLQALAAFDGLTQAITLLPSSLPREYLPELLRAANSDFLLTDAADMPGNLPVSVVYRSLDEIDGRQTAAADGITATEWHLATSGTTGVPKLVCHTLESLVRTTKMKPVADAVPCWGLLYDYTRFAGLQVLLQAALSGSRLAVPPVDASMSERIRFLANEQCTHLSATPTQWRAIAMTPGAERLTLRQVTLGGEIVDDRLLNVLSTLYPSARVTHIYAATEAGVGFSVNDRRSGFPASYLREPPAGVDLRTEDGRLFIRNTAARPGYVGNPVKYCTDDGWIDTGDNVEQIGDRVFFLGRASGLLNVGGNKVHPEEIERVLMEHPAVELVRVHGRPSSIMGTVIAADVVLATRNQDRQAVCRELKAFVRARVAAEKVPAIINVVDRLDIMSTGKLSRNIT